MKEDKDQGIPVERCPRCKQIMPHTKLEKWWSDSTTTRLIVIFVVVTFCALRGAYEMIHDVVKLVTR